MNNSDKPRNTSRRSFIKKSVVASVAATNLTMFSGLVNAQESSPSDGGGNGSGCGNIVKVDLQIGGQYVGTRCSRSGNPADCTDKKYCYDKHKRRIEVPCGSTNVICYQH